MGSGTLDFLQADAAARAADHARDVLVDRLADQAGDDGRFEPDLLRVGASLRSTALGDLEAPAVARFPELVHRLDADGRGVPNLQQPSLTLLGHW